jgi:hypothetical protein
MKDLHKHNSLYSMLYLDLINYVAYVCIFASEIYRSIILSHCGSSRGALSTVTAYYSMYHKYRPNS